MAWYKRSDYGPNPHEGASRNNAATRGWGPGWPDCQRSKQQRVEVGDVAVLVRKEIASLIKTLMTVTEQRYRYPIKDGQTWGFACRAIRGTNTASNHSWGLAVDINSLANPMQSTFQSDIPPNVVRMWEACGFYWGGRYPNRPDAMHFEYIGRPSDVARHTAKAKSYIQQTEDDDMTPAQAAKLDQAAKDAAYAVDQLGSIGQALYLVAKGLNDGHIDLAELQGVTDGLQGKR